MHDYKVQYRVWYRILSTISIELITVSCPIVFLKVSKVFALIVTETNMTQFHIDF